jgi:uncharacterized heparinase superfamily protein
LIKRDDVDPNDRVQVFRALQSFDHRGMDDAELERRMLALLDLEARSAAEVLAHYSKKFTALPGPEVSPPGGAPKKDPIAAADDVLQHRFSFYDEVHQLGTAVDWEHNPGTAHWGHDLNRFSFLNILIEAMKRKNDERYGKKCVELILHWVNTTDVCDGFFQKKSPYVWSSYLNIAIHLQVWSTTLVEFRGRLPDFVSPRDWLLILKSIHDQLRYLEIVIPERVNNWVNIGTRGMLFTLSVFGEFKGARGMVEVAWERLAASVQRQVLPDGVQDELAQDYHVVVLNNILTPLAVQESLPIPAPEALASYLPKMLHYLRQVLTPDGKTVAFNDSDPNFSPRVAATLSHPISRRALGASADAELRSECFPYSGVMIMRQGSRIGRDELYMAFDGGPFGTSHQHEDKLSFWLSAYGRSLIVDPGRHLYDWSEKSLYPHLKTTRAHSTIRIDGQDQNSRANSKTPGALRATGPLPLTWEVSPDGPVTAGASYELGYGPELVKVSHRRTIRFVPAPGYWIVDDEVSGDGAHEIESRFQFAPGSLNVQGRRVRTQFADANLLLATREEWDACTVESGLRNPDSGWYSDGVNKIEPAPVLILRAKRTLPFRSRIVLCPYKGTAAPAESTVTRLLSE